MPKVSFKEVMPHYIASKLQSLVLYLSVYMCYSQYHDVAAIYCDISISHGDANV